MDVMNPSRGILAAHQPLVVPMQLRLSHFRLNAYVVLVVSKSKGITLVFKTDPLQNVDVNSTFDSIAVIQKFIQKEIEGQLREMFREDLPAIIHRLSQKWTAGQTKVEAPYLQKNPTTLPKETVYTPPATTTGRPVSDYGPRRPLGSTPGLRPAFVPRPTSLSRLTPLSATSSRPHSALSESRPKSKSSPPTERSSSFPDLEEYDPTYGLRPEGIPLKSAFGGLGRLFTANKGLADLDDVDEEARTQHDEVDIDEWVEESTNPPSEPQEEYETLPAVGGGTITRPRVYHSQSMLGMPTEIRVSRPPSVAHSLRMPLRTGTPGLLGQIGRAASVASDPVSAWREQQMRETVNPYFPEPGPSRWGSMSDTQTPRRTHRKSRMEDVEDRRRASASSDPRLSSSSSYTRLSDGSGPPATTVSTPPSSHLDSPEKDRRRRRSISPSMLHPFDVGYGSPPKHDPQSPDDDPPHLILRPNLNHSISHLSSLSLSNHTLSPYGHSVEHFTVRSIPPRPPKTPDQMSFERERHKEPVRARRKRTTHLGRRTAVPVVVQPSPSPPSEFSDDVDHYFK